MTADLANALNRAGIKLPSYTIGRTHRVRCPRCKRGEHQKDGALAVTIKAAADVVWNCHRCHWASGWKAGDAMAERVPEVAHGQKAAEKRHRGLSDYGLRIWDQSKPVTADDPAGRYLIGRCCSLPQNDVRFHPSIWHSHERQAFPAMVALITDIINCKPMSLHFTFLDPDGGGKAKVEKERLLLKDHCKQGGVVRLTPDDEVTQGIILGEGIETSLSYALEYSGAWACLDAGNLGAFPVLPGIQGLTVLVDNDKAGRDAFAAVRNRYRAAGFAHPLDVIGIEVEGKPGADVNDLVAA